MGAAEENFLRQVNAEVSAGNVLLNLLLKNKGKLAKDIKGTEILPCRKHRLGALNPVRQRQKKIMSLDFRKANFGFLRDHPGRLKGRLLRESEGHRTAAWYLFTASLLRAWKQATADCRKSSKHRRRPARPNEELRLEEETQGKWKH